MAEHRKAKARQWLDETFPETPPGADVEPLIPEPAETSEDPNGGASTSAPSAFPPDVPPSDPVLDDVDEDDTPAPPSARPEARRRRENRGRRRGGEGVTFAPGMSGDTSRKEDGRPVGRLGGDRRRGGARGRERALLEWIGFIIGVALQIALDVALMLTPSIKSRQRRYGVADNARGRRAAAARTPAETYSHRGARRRGGSDPGSGRVEDDDAFRPAARGTAGARRRALDRVDVPPELRGRVSAARWKRELLAYHEEQVRLAAAQLRGVGGAAPAAAAATREKAVEGATEHARREVR